MTPMRLCRSLSANLATALAVAALLVVPRARAADAPPAPTASAILAASTNTVSATNAAAPDLKPVPVANPLPLPASDERVAGQREENPQPPTNPPPATITSNTPPTGVAPGVTNPLAPAVTLPSATAPAPSRSAATSSRETKSPTSSSTSAPRIDFSTFKILGERNIFDPNRSSRGSRSSAPPSDTPPPRPAAPTIVEAFSLVGTLAYGENQMAFIDGPSSEYKKALRLNDTIASLKLKSVAANQATFDNDGKEISLRIGHQLRREDRGEWQVNSQPTAYPSAPLAPTGTNNTSSASATNSVSGDTTSALAPGAAPVVVKPEPAPTAAEAEALRRHLEQRRKEEEK